MGNIPVTHHLFDTSNSLTLTFNTSEICTRVSNEGCMSLVHHLETVVVFFPSLSASHLLVLPCSTSTIFILLIAFLAILMLQFLKEIAYYIKYMV